MAETLTVVGVEVMDEFGDLIETASSRKLPGCVVGLRGQADVDGGGVFDGDATTLEVFAPPGTQIAEGEIVECRGERFRVVHVPFDWSVGRQPCLRRHRPRVQFVIERVVA